MKQAAVIGGGNGGHAIAADLSMRGFDICLYEDAAFAEKMQSVFDTGEIQLSGVCGNGTAKIFKVTSDMEEAVRDVKHIFVAVPAFAHRAVAEKLAHCVKAGQVIVLFPGTFDSLLFYKLLKDKGAPDHITVAETHTLPYATRLTGMGHSLIMSCFRPLKIGVMPSERTGEIVEELKHYYDCLESVESVVACGLNSLNPLIHVPGCILNAGRIQVAKGEFYFYTEGFTSCVAQATAALDKERISLLKALGYEADIASHGLGGVVQTDDIQEAVAGNSDFAKIKGPADLNNRYFTEDIPYGIAAWAKLAALLHVHCPLMEAFVNLGGAILGQDSWSQGTSMEELGLEGKSVEEIKEYLTND